VQADLVRDTLRSTWMGAAGQQSASYLGLVTESPGAYQEFLRGESIVGTSPAEVHEAVRHFESAAALDPGFALAWAEALGPNEAIVATFNPGGATYSTLPVKNMWGVTHQTTGAINQPE
jgi:hypothetical protein